MDLDNITEEDYFAEMKTMFNTTGWQLLLRELDDNVKILSDIQAIKDSDDLFFRKGQVATCAYMMNFEEIIKKGEIDYYETLKQLAEELADEGS